MIKQVLAIVDLTIWAEVALLIFAAVFIAVSIRTLRGDRQQSERNAGLALAEEGVHADD